jgi:hypothetical protein
MKLLEIIQAADARISGCDPYMWRCYGTNANFLEFRTVKGEGYCHCVFDTKTYEVYYVYVEIPNTNDCWQWNNPNHFDAYLKECEDRNVGPYDAWDDVKWKPMLSSKEALERITSIGNDY